MGSEPGTDGAGAGAGSIVSTGALTGTVRQTLTADRRKPPLAARLRCSSL
jgi:hypothetical protein